MNTYKKNLTDFPTEKNHHASVNLKRLVLQGQLKGMLATVNYAWLDRKDCLEEHTHDDGEEMYLILDGSGIMRIRSDEFPVKKNDFITVPQHAIHELRNTDSNILLFLTIRTKKVKTDA